MEIEEVKKEEKPVVEKRALVEVNDNGFLQAKDIEGKFRIARVLFESKMVPRAYESAHQVLAAMEFAVEMGLKPFSGLRNIALINGQPSLWGDLPLALARRTGDVEWVKEFLIDKAYNIINFANKNLHEPVWAGVSIIKRKNEADAYEAIFTMDDAKTAGLLDRKSTPWQTYPKVMLMRRARSMNLKVAFPEALSGAIIAEYDYNTIPEIGEAKDVTYSGEPKTDPAKELNDLFAGQTTVN